jgi:hypothetical protein
MILRLQTLSKRASRRPEPEAHLVAERADVPEELILSSIFDEDDPQYSVGHRRTSG